MLKNNNIYSLASNYTKYTRRNSSAVNIGTTTIGSDAEILVQSMATVDTNLCKEGADQAQRIFEAGAKWSDSQLRA